MILWPGVHRPNEAPATCSCWCPCESPYCGKSRGTCLSSPCSVSGFIMLQLLLVVHQLMAFQLTLIYIGGSIELTLGHIVCNTSRHKVTPLSKKPYRSMLNQQGHLYQPELRLSQQSYLDGIFSYVIIFILLCLCGTLAYLCFCLGSCKIMVSCPSAYSGHLFSSSPLEHP